MTIVAEVQKNAFEKEEQEAILRLTLLRVLCEKKSTRTYQSEYVCIQ